MAYPGRRIPAPQNESTRKGRWPELARCPWTTQKILRTQVRKAMRDVRRSKCPTSVLERIVPNWRSCCFAPVTLRMALGGYPPPAGMQPLALAPAATGSVTRVPHCGMPEGSILVWQPGRCQPFFHPNGVSRLKSANPVPTRRQCSYLYKNQNFVSCGAVSRPQARLTHRYVGRRFFTRRGIFCRRFGGNSPF